MISSVAWVPKGVADPNPKRYEVSAAEAELLNNPAALEKLLLKEENKQDAASSSSNNKDKLLPKMDNSNSNSLPADLRMDEYSSDEEDNDAAIGNLLVGRNEEEEEEIVMQNQQDEEENDNEDSDDDDDDDEEDDWRDVPDTREFVPLSVEGFDSLGLTQTGGGTYDKDEYEDDASDAEDVQLHPDDAILLVAKTEDDFASLEVHVYEPKDGNLYVHHDIPLPSFPLCLAHGDVNSDGGSGNYCAVGTFSPTIEIWNLDVLNALEPSCVLGGVDRDSDELLRAQVLGSRPKQAKAKTNHPNNHGQPQQHTDAVMALSWNKVHRQVVASGSADRTVKLWDVTHPSRCCSASLTHHKDKVGAVAWHGSEGALLATGSYDRTVSLVDARRATLQQPKTVQISADIEALEWDPFAPHLLAAATEDGTLTCWDVRNFTEPLWSFVAKEYGGVCDFSYNCHVPGLMVTCAIDKTVTLWDTHHFDSNQNCGGDPPRPCGTKDMGVGRLHTVSFYPSSPFLLACGGGGNEVALWDLSRDEAIQNRFGARVAGGAATSSSTNETKKEEEPRQEAIMAATNDAAAETARNKATKKKKKKKGKDKHRKAHKKGR